MEQFETQIFCEIYFMSIELIHEYHLYDCYDSMQFEYVSYKLSEELIAQNMRNTLIKSSASLHFNNWKFAKF